MVREKTKTEALDALDGMRTIVRAEMLTRGTYVDDEISNPRRAGALCGGRKHCAVGSLWVAAGIRPRLQSGFLALPGTGSGSREGFLRKHAALRLAYSSLNDAARDFADQRGLTIYGFDHGIEALFENHYAEDLTKRDLLAVIAAAKRRVKAATTNP